MAKLKKSEKVVEREQIAAMVQQLFADDERFRKYIEYKDNFNSYAKNPATVSAGLPYDTYLTHMKIGRQQSSIEDHELLTMEFQGS